MLYIVNRSLNITKQENKIFFNNGSWNELTINCDFDIYALLECFAFPTEISTVIQNVDYDSNAVTKLVDTLIAKKIIVPYDEAATRNDLFFQRFTDLDAKKIKKLRVLIIGGGTLGSTLTYSLAKLGVENLCVVDPDVVSKHQVCAQMLFTDKDINKYKVDVIADRIISEFGSINILPVKMKICTATNFVELMEMMKFDFVINCADEISGDVLFDILHVLKFTDCRYIDTGYIALSDIVFYISNYTEYINYVANVKHIQKNTRRLASNSGIIIDSLMVSAVVISTIIHSLNEKIDNAYLAVDVYNLKVNDLRKKSPSREHFISELKQYFMPSVLEQHLHDYLEYGLSYNATFVDMFNFVMFLKRINLLESVGADDYYRQLTTKYEVNEPEANQEIMQIFKLQNSQINYNSIQEAMRVVNISGSSDLQNKIYKYLEINKKSLLNLLKLSRLAVKAETNVLDSKLLSDARNITESEYNEICRHDLSLTYDVSIPRSIDFLQMRDPLSQMFLASEALPEFLHDLICSLPTRFQSVLNEFIKSNGLYIDNASKLVKGQTYYSPIRQKSYVYCAYDVSLQSFFTLLHELGHYVSNQIYDHMNFYERTFLEREVLADAFVFFLLSHIDANTDENFKKVKSAGIKYYFMHPLRYMLDTLLFVDKIDDYIKLNKDFTCADYTAIYHWIFKREQLGINYKNSEIFMNNYLANEEIYRNDSSIVNSLLVRLTAILFSESIYMQNNNINYETIFNFYKKNSLLEALLQAYKLGGNII